MKNRNVEAAESYINGLKRKDLSSVPLAPDVIFEGPLSPDKLHGAKSVIQFLSGILPIIKDVRIKQHVGDGEPARLHMERNLVFLGTVGANAPFVGLLGTVIGIIRSFHSLDQSQGKVTAGLMADIGEALVATAPGRRRRDRCGHMGIGGKMAGGRPRRNVRVSRRPLDRPAARAGRCDHRSAPKAEGWRPSCPDTH